jgi:hypothetical protein
MRFLAATFALLLAACSPSSDKPDPTRRSPTPKGGEGGLLNEPVMFDTPQADKILESLAVFPPDNPWNQDISGWPVAADSAKLVASIGRDKPFRCNYDQSFILVPPGQPRIGLTKMEYKDESDPGPYPIPDTIPIEGWPRSSREQDPGITLAEVQRDAKNRGGDRHALVVDPVNRKLYEFFEMKRTDAGWQASCAAIFDLTSNALRPDGWTSADAAGLPIFPAVVRYDELQRGEIRHALRFTVRKTRRAYVAPATHYASQDKNPALPRMGERFRLRRDFDVSSFSKPAQVILRALQKYGMLVADNGIEWAISMTPDDRMPDLHPELRKVKGADFEVVEKPR